VPGASLFLVEGLLDVEGHVLVVFELSVVLSLVGVSTNVHDLFSGCLLHVTVSETGDDRVEVLLLALIDLGMRHLNFY
jgi:hypothetical protein